MFRTILRLIAAVAAAVTLLAVPASAGAAPAPAASAARAAAPAPAQASVYRPGAVAQLPPKKPATAAPNTVRPAVWAVTLTVDKSVLWPTQHVTLTATANGDVAGTPYYIMIYEETGAHRPLIWCSTGSTCSVSATTMTPGNLEYEAEIATGPTLTFPPAGVIAAEAVTVLWWSAPVRLLAQPETAAPGQPIALSARADFSGAPSVPSPFLIEIYDATAGTMEAVCEGDSCNYTATQNTATTHRYVAYTVPYSPVFPPPNIQSMSPSTWATWSPTGWTVVSISVPDSQDPVPTDDPVTATVNHDLGPTPYWLDVYVEQNNADGTAVTGTLVMSCGTGTTCTASRFGLPVDGTLVAFVDTKYPASFPPPGIQAVSTFHYTLYNCALDGPPTAPVCGPWG